MPNHDVRAVANEFLRRAENDGRHLTNMQLQKLPYIAHGWGLVTLPMPLIRQVPQTWPYGPVYSDLYQDLKRYGAGAVQAYIRQNNTSPFPDDRGPEVWEEMIPQEVALLDQVWRSYGHLNGLALSEMTHRAGTPWTITMQKSGAYSPIENQLIAEHYQNLRQQNAG
ncbi:Panacea domain-containing protein [Acetobacter senegalensis]|uniref:Panacea domain-containing protein n=1 Tax=Acetobacter senegalensis TaxID=446692 RepID=UPI00073F79B4|nr:type II toxin-antitoxin system antitoxin SocA domain-containing protein [Acetobacter senegalensis]